MRTIFFLVSVCFLTLGWSPQDFAKGAKPSDGSTKKSGGNKNNGGNKKNDGGDKKDNKKPATYYFSAKYGNDSRTFAQSQNPSTPWKSIAKLNSVFSSLQPGDAVLFKRDETFYGSITLGQSGKAGLPIVIGAYGTGEKPIITSLVKLAGWKANPKYKGVYDCAVTSALGAEVNIVLLNNVLQQIGRYPNRTAANKGYLKFESHQGKSSLTDNQLSSYPNWTGAEAVIRTRKWLLDRSVIKSHSKNKIYLSPEEMTYGPRDGFGYFIQDHIKTLDQFGEWYYNPSKKVVSIYFGTKNPSSYDIKASSVNSLIYSFRKSYVVIDNLTLKGANKFGVDINGGNNITVKNCDILFSGIDGVNAAKNTYFNLENCSVLNSNNNGVTVSGSAHAAVRNNFIKNSYAISGMGQSGNGQGVGIRISSNSIAEYNRVINSGYIAIAFSGNDLIIKNNLLDTFSFIKDDGAAIYTSNGPNVTNKGRKITGNIILNGIGAPDGANTTASSADGIYMDDNVNGAEITGNTIANTNRGIYLHNSRNIVVKNNTSFNNKFGQLYMKHDWLGSKIRKQTITNNIFFSKLAKQTAASVATVLGDNDITNWGKFDNNYYARPIDDKLVFSITTYYNSGKEYRNNLHLEGWKSKYGVDASSKRSAKKIIPFGVPDLIGANKFSEGSFNTRTDVKRVWANNCSLTMGNSGVLDGGYLKVVPSAAKSSIVLFVGALSSSKNYILNYSLKGSGNMSIGAYLRGSDYDPLTPSQFRAVSTNRSENQLIFTPSASEKRNGAIVLTVDARSTYYLDNIQLYEAKATITNPDDSIRFVYNAAKVNKTFRLDGQYVDVKNNKFSNSIVLEPYASAVLIKTKTTKAAAKNAAPTVSITNPVANARFTAPASIKISAAATDKDGTISKVEFYNGSQLLETKYSAPYTFTRNNVKEGKYTLTAKATDNSGNAATSAGVSISVGSKKAPTVRLINPDNNRVYKGAANIYIRALANSSTGRIKKVDFYSNNRLLGTQNLYPFVISWKNVPPGTYTLKAIATDNNNLSTTSAPVKVTVAAKSKSRVSSRPSSQTSITAPDSALDKLDLSDNTASLKVSPNPVSTTLNIAIKGLEQNKELTISVVSVSGNTVKTIRSNTSGQVVQMDVSSLNNGVYIIKVVCGNKVLSQQFVKL